MVGTATTTKPFEPATSTGRVQRGGWRRHAPTIAVVTIYCALSVACYWHLWAGGLSHVYTVGADRTQVMWSLNWLPYALGHGLNPFHSSLANVPYGVNILANPSIPLLGLLFAPITLLFGAAATFNVASTVALAGSATSMYFVARRFTTWRPAAFVAGLVYGFGPYEITHGTGQLNLSFCILPPLILLLVHDIAVKQDGHARRRGILLGLLAAGQFFVSTEVLATTALIGLVLLVAIAVRGHRVAGQHLRDVAEALAWAAGMAVVLLAYPAWFAVAGPQHITGAVQDAHLYRADLLGPVVPDSLLRIAPTSLSQYANHFAGGPAENGSYLGITLLGALLVAVIVLRRRAEVQILALVGAVAFILSLGPRLVVHSAPTDQPAGDWLGRIPLPETVLTHLPLFSVLLPARFALFVDMAAALLFAIFLDWLRTRAPGRHGQGSILPPLIVAGVALVLLIPSIPFLYTGPLPTSQYFSSSLARQLPAGQPAVVYPYPDALDTDAMQWQMDAGMRFALVGGYFLIPAQPSAQTIATSALAPNSLQSATGTLLSQLYADQAPPRTAAVRRGVLGDFRRWGVRSVVAVPPAGTAPRVVPYLTWLLGRAPKHEADAYTWYHVDQQPVHP
jgi:hypothetical protein